MYETLLLRRTAVYNLCSQRNEERFGAVPHPQNEYLRPLTSPPPHKKPPITTTTGLWCVDRSSMLITTYLRSWSYRLSQRLKLYCSVYTAACSISGWYSQLRSTSYGRVLINLVRLLFMYMRYLYFFYIFCSSCCIPPSILTAVPLTVSERKTQTTAKVRQRTPHL